MRPRNWAQATAISILEPLAKRRSRIPLVCVSLSLLAALLHAQLVMSAELPRPVLPEGVGVNIHFVRGHDQDLDRIADAGFKVVRMDFSWSEIERQRGEYDWSGYDELTANLERRGLQPLYILDYSNALYEETVTSHSPITGQSVTTVASPARPESVAAFARWAGAAAERYRGRRVIWEIWNEPNIHFWQPEPKVEDYLTLATATCQAIRQADASATIIAPATSGFPWDFLTTFVQSGILKQLDGISVHPYRRYELGPETAGDDYRRLRALLDAHTPPDRGPLPILSGEWGYATHTRGIAPDTQAAFLVRQQLANLYHGIPLSIWYDWKNDGPDPEEREHNFGTVGLDLEPKPAFVAARVLTRQLSGYRVLRRLEAPSEHAWLLLCENEAGERKLAAWSSSARMAVQAALDGIPFQEFAAVDGMGQRREISLADGRLVLELDAQPQYVELKNTMPSAINQSFSDPDVESFVSRFETEGREVYENREKILASCGLQPGMSVADIGAGTGLFSRLFSPAVGPEGRVYAVDVSRNFVEHIRAAAREKGLENVQAVLCQVDSVDLAPQSIDLAFICDTYHHFEYPYLTLASIHKALKPAGQLVVVDFERIEGVSSEWTLNHVRAGRETFQREIEASGFRLIEQVDLMKENYFLRFGKES